MNIRKFLQTAVMAGALLGLAGCEDIHNAGSEIGQRFDDMHFSNPFKSDGAKIAETPAVTNCMPVTVVSELKSLSQFSDEMAPRAENNISTVSIGTVTSKCAQNDKNLSVDLDIAFNGLLGARARSWNAAKPSFSYPYFVALTMPDGAIVTKEVFSVTVSYDKDQDTVTRHEHMRQVIPLLQGVTSRPQQVVIGFQLTKSQLSYNRSLAGKQNVAAGPVPADLAASDKKTAPATAAKKARPKVKAKAKHKKPKPVAKPAAAPAVTTAPDATSAPAPAPVTQTPSPAAEETPSDLTAPVNNAAPAATTTTTTTTTTMPEVNATPPAQSPANSAPAAATPVPVAPTPPAPPAQPSSDKPMEMENLMTTPPPSGQQ